MTVLPTPARVRLVFGTGDYTIECWFYNDNSHNGTGGRCYLFDTRLGGSQTGDPPQVIANLDGDTTLNFQNQCNNHYT